MFGKKKNKEDKDMEKREKERDKREKERSKVQTKKLAEAQEQLKLAEKALSTSAFKWSADYMAAAPYLEKAAEAYRAANELEEAKKVFARAAATQKRNGSSFKAAQHSEQIAKIVEDQFRHRQFSSSNRREQARNELRSAYETASGHYADMGELGKAAEALVKAATACDKHGAEDVSDLYLQASDLVETQGKAHFSAETYRKTTSYLVKKRKYDQALTNLRREKDNYKEMSQDHSVHKCHLSEVVLYLAVGDVAAADEAHMRHLQDDSYLSSDPCELADDLLRAFKTSSEELLGKTTKRQAFQVLDTEVGKLVRTLQLPYMDDVPAAKPSKKKQSGMASAAAAAQSAMDDVNDTLNDIDLLSDGDGSPADDFDFDSLEFAPPPPQRADSSKSKKFFDRVKKPSRKKEDELDLT